MELKYSSNKEHWYDSIFDAVDLSVYSKNDEVEIFSGETITPEHRDLIPDILDDMGNTAADRYGEFGMEYLSDLSSEQCGKLEQLVKDCVSSFLDKEAQPINFFHVSETKRITLKVLNPNKNIFEIISSAN